MLSAQDKEVLRKVYQFVPQFGALLENRINKELNDLPSVSLDKVQVFQGRCLALQELLADLEATGVSANRTAKPPFSTP